jgi:hypothetical protein
MRPSMNLMWTALAFCGGGYALAQPWPFWPIAIPLIAVAAVLMISADADLIDDEGEGP